MNTEDYSLDRRAMRRAFSAASNQYDSIAVLQKEVRARLLERLALFKLQPHVVLDLGCGTAFGSRVFQQQYRDAQVIALDSALGMLQYAKTSRGWFGRKQFQRVCADAYQLPFKSASVDLIFSNLMLQWCDPPDAVFNEVRRMLKPQGVFIFSTFGPDTLRELRDAWGTVDAHTHVNRFIDMHDLGDAMMRAGLSEPVLDVERFTLTYPDVISLMRELKAIGAHNVTQGRSHGLTGRTALNRVMHHYERHRRDEALPASYEVIYGQAWGNTYTSSSIDKNEVRIPVERIGRRS